VEVTVSGTIVCGVGDSAEGREAIQVAVALSRRLGQRLVLVHVRRRATGADGLLQRLSEELGLDEAVELREGVGDTAQVLAEIAAEEGADLIILASRRAGLRRRTLECRLSLELEPATAVPVVIAPPQTLRRSGRRLGVI
jgi:nucleotide-binding universal stress UspA family protein